MFGPQQQHNAVMKSMALSSPLTSGDTEAQGHATGLLPTGPETEKPERPLLGCPPPLSGSQRDQDPCARSKRSILTPGTHLPVSGLTLVGDASLSLLETHGQHE